MIEIRELELIVLPIPTLPSSTEKRGTEDWIPTCDQRFNHSYPPRETSIKTLKNETQGASKLMNILINVLGRWHACESTEMEALYLTAPDLFASSIRQFSCYNFYNKKVIVCGVLSVSFVSHSGELWNLSGDVIALKFVVSWEEMQIAWEHQRPVAGLWSRHSLTGLNP